MVVVGGDAGPELESVRVQALYFRLSPCTNLAGCWRCRRMACCLRSSSPAWRVVAEEGGVRVEDQVSRWPRRSGRRRRLLFTGHVHLTQSCVELDRAGEALWSAPCDSEYTQAFCLVFGVLRHRGWVAASEPSRVCMLGGGCGAWPMQVRRTTSVVLDVVEISAVVASLARQHFGLVEDDCLTYHVACGREFVEAAPPGSYDAIVIDVCSSAVGVPAPGALPSCGAHFHVLEAPPPGFVDAKWLREALVPALDPERGVACLNVVGSREALRRVAATFASEFASSAAFATTDDNIVFFGFRGSADVPPPTALLEAMAGLDGSGRLRALAPAAMNLLERTPSFVDERHLCGWLNPTQFAELLWTAKFVYSDE